MYANLQTSQPYTWHEEERTVRSGDNVHHIHINNYPSCGDVSPQYCGNSMPQNPVCNEYKPHSLWCGKLCVGNYPIAVSGNCSVGHDCFLQTKPEKVGVPVVKIVSSTRDEIGFVIALSCIPQKSWLRLVFMGEHVIAAALKIANYPLTFDVKDKCVIDCFLPFHIANCTGSGSVKFANKRAKHSIHASIILPADSGASEGEHAEACDC